MTGSVLIVEDENATRDVMSGILEECGFAVSAVADLGSARALMRADVDEFDFVLLASQLPDGDGLSFCAELRADRFDRPIIVVGDLFSTQLPASRAGASAWIQKPFTISGLLEQVEAALVQHCDAAFGPTPETRFRPAPLC